MTRGRVVLVVAVLLVVETRAAADPLPEVTYLLNESELVVPGPPPLTYRVPSGTRLLAPSAWLRLDAEIIRLQDAEVRLTAENNSLRDSASAWTPGWRTLALTLVVGLVGGAYVASKF